MKILMINVVCGIRSTGRICADLATALEAQGHEVRIAYGRECVPDQYQKYAVRIGTDLDVKLHGVKARFFDKAGFGSKGVTKKFIEWIKKYNPDVIHLHNLHGYYLNIEVLFNYLKMSGKKIIWTLHDCWAITGHSAYCDAIQCEKWIDGCRDCPLRNEYPKAYVDNSAMNWKLKREIFSDVSRLQIVTPSNWLAALVKKSFLSEYPVTVVHNGIDTSQFYPLKSDFKKVYRLNGKKVLLGVASTWNDMKGYSDFIRLASMMDLSYRIVLVGVTKEQKNSLPPNMIGIERTNSIRELAAVYSGCDIFVNLTYCDTYPTVNLEAISCGKFVVSYATGGAPESIEGYGCTVERGNLEKIKDEVEKFFENPKMVAPNVEMVAELDEATAIEKYIKLYQRL